MLPGGIFLLFFDWTNKLNPSFLDHRVEPKRLAQADTLSAELGSILTPDSAQIWTGDFNALTREDYSGDEVTILLL